MAATTTHRCRVVAIAAFLVLALASCCAASAAPSMAPESAAAPSPAENPCLTALYNMSDCLSYVEEGNNQTKPDKGCCPEAAGLLDSNPICLCQLLSNPDAIGIKIDLNKALKLPSVCGLTTPPISTCAAVGYPVSLPPGASPSPSTAPEGPTSANSPSSGMAAPGPGGASPSSDEAAASPSGNRDKNGASGIEASALTFIFGLATVSASIFF